MLSSTAIIDKIVDRITKKPTKPKDTLYSRRRHAEVEISGDALVFPLEDNVINPAFVGAIKEAQNAIFKAVEEDPKYLHKRWDNKAERHQEKYYKRHKKLHLAFLGTIPIGTRAACEEIAKTRTPKQMIEAQQVLTEFVNQNIMSGNVKECKWNEDGHLVVRVDINPAQALFDCKAKLHDIFGSSYNRYDEPEKQKTLASVIGVIDSEKISFSTKSKINGILQQLEIDLKAIKPLVFTSIEWIVYDKRTLSENSRLFVWSCNNRTNNPMQGAIANINPTNIHPASLFYLPASEEIKTSHQNLEYHPAAWRRSY